MVHDLFRNVQRYRHKRRPHREDQYENMEAKFRFSSVNNHQLPSLVNNAVKGSGNVLVKC